MADHEQIGSVQCQVGSDVNVPFNRHSYQNPQKGDVPARIHNCKIALILPPT